MYPTVNGLNLLIDIANYYYWSKITKGSISWFDVPFIALNFPKLKYM